MDLFWGPPPSGISSLLLLPCVAEARARVHGGIALSRFLSQAPGRDFTPTSTGRFLLTPRL